MRAQSRLLWCKKEYWKNKNKEKIMKIRKKNKNKEKRMKIRIKKK